MDFGAKADGKTIDSPAINRAIEVLAQYGGGTVYLPAGEYACYSIRLKATFISIWNRAPVSLPPFPEKRKDMIPPNRMNIISIGISVTAIGKTL